MNKKVIKKLHVKSNFNTENDYEFLVAHMVTDLGKYISSFKILVLWLENVFDHSCGFGQ